MTNLINKLKEIEQKSKYVQTSQYEDWLYDFLEKHHIADDWEDRYLYNKPEDISDADIENIFLLHYYWEHMRDKYSTPEPEECQDIFADIEGEHKFKFQLRDLNCLFTRIAGCGCYEHTIKVA